MTQDPLYPIIHLRSDDIECVLTHTKQFGEEYYSFVNGQHTPRRAAPTSQLSARHCPELSRNISAKTSSIPT